ncbi:type II toxin-antitoxin system Phd/YefM family antitoxin [Candidatus Palauibacter sp.]|uniref:type II toxin-antitoxin system Phd/YefM family antitoxin n=1 Tax=Candidatus Palauibacter sp. TaxID=3101350 RepID=UPI003C702B3E
MTPSNHGPYSRRSPRLAWKLAEAKARFSEVVRLAASGRPQRVTVRGRDTVVVVGAAEFDELQARAKQVTLHELLSQSPLNRLDFGEEGVRSPVRDVVL